MGAGLLTSIGSASIAKASPSLVTMPQKLWITTSSCLSATSVLAGQQPLKCTQDVMNCSILVTLEEWKRRHSSKQEQNGSMIIKTMWCKRSSKRGSLRLMPQLWLLLCLQFIQLVMDKRGILVLLWMFLLLLLQVWCSKQHQMSYSRCQG